MYEMFMTFTFMVWVYVLILFALLAASCAVIYIIYFVWDCKGVPDFWVIEAALG